MEKVHSGMSGDSLEVDDGGVVRINSGGRAALTSGAVVNVESGGKILGEVCKCQA